MAFHSRHGRSTRLAGIAALSVGAALLLPAASAGAAPKPSAAATRKKLAELNRKVDKLGNKYDKAKTDLDAAKKHLAALNHQVAADSRQQQNLRARVVQIAIAAYKNGTLDSSTLLAAKNPETALGEMSAFTKLSSTRNQELTAFLASAQRLRREQAQAQTLVRTVSSNTAALKKQKATVQKAIKKQKALLPKPTTITHATGATYTGPASGPARKAVQYAYAQIGKPYVFGGTGPDGFDCSGLTMMAWRAAGVSIPRVVPDQYHAIHHVAKADLQAGDLVFFDDLGHEGIYVGSGKFVHAPHTGTDVQFASMSNPYWVSHYVGAGRP